MEHLCFKFAYRMTAFRVFWKKNGEVCSPQKQHSTVQYACLFLQKTLSVYEDYTSMYVCMYVCMCACVCNVLYCIVRCSSVGLADGQYRRRTGNVGWSSVWDYRIHWRLLRMREASRCPTTSNTRHQQRSVHWFDVGLLMVIITDKMPCPHGIRTSVFKLFRGNF